MRDTSNGTTKIGISKTPLARFRNLSTGNTDLKMMWISPHPIPNAEQVEKMYLHKLFAGFRVDPDREFFDFGSEADRVEGWIKRHISAGVYAEQMKFYKGLPLTVRDLKTYTWVKPI